MGQRIRRQNALVIKIADEGYLSEHNNIVDFNHARIIKSPKLANKLAKFFNDTMMITMGMKYELEIELIVLEYKTTGQCRKYEESE
ncbi:hypothetical protein [Staphylococcus equorum]|uniref:hypothetical protein n=1 Tax=Staphylococcus equorum TaxID=246432 RepID=UPI002552A3DD|nr:hypothetical protein [Staphylococcus equorum]MDK9870292.1 hypothetical protein [Staphylococcus equorum]